MNRVYLDNASTTPLDSDVLEKMMPYLTSIYGNASSVHGAGRKARYAIEDARERIARVLGCEPAEIIFTSGGTESDNLAIKSMGALPTNGKIASGKTEHKAVLAPMARQDICWVPADRFGGISVQAIAVAAGCAAASVMMVNNETGAVNDISNIAAELRGKGAILHTDAVQAAGLFDVNVEEYGVDLMTLSAHKIGGPKGSGLLYVRAGSPLHELIEGGNQERGRRGGTENVAGIIGFARALDNASAGRESWFEACSKLRQRLHDGLAEAIDIPYVVNSPEGGAPHIYNIAFPPIDGVAVDGEMLILNLDVEGVCVSSGSACTSGAVEPSHVLLAAGLDAETASASLRFSFGKQNTDDDVDFAVETLARCVKRMTSKSNQSSAG